MIFDVFLDEAFFGGFVVGLFEVFNELFGGWGGETGEFGVVESEAAGDLVGVEIEIVEVERDVFDAGFIDDAGVVGDELVGDGKHVESAEGAVDDGVGVLELGLGQRVELDDEMVLFEIEVFKQVLGGLFKIFFTLAESWGVEDDGLAVGEVGVFLEDFCLYAFLVFLVVQEVNAGEGENFNLVLGEAEAGGEVGAVGGTGADGEGVVFVHAQGFGDFLVVGFGLAERGVAKFFHGADGVPELDDGEGGFVFEDTDGGRVGVEEADFAGREVVHLPEHMKTVV